MKEMSVRFELFCESIRNAVDFYCSVLGFKEIQTYDDYVVVQNGTVVIGLCSVDGLKSDHYFRPEIITNRKGLGVEIVFEVENIQEDFNRVKATGYPIFEDFKRQEWGLSDFRIVDPDGYYIRFTSRT